MQNCFEYLFFFYSYTPVTIKAEPGRRVQFLGIGRRVEVGERSLVAVTIKSVPAGNRPTYLEMRSNYRPVYRPVSGWHSSDVFLCPCDTHVVSGRVPANSYRPNDVRQGIAHIGRAPGQILDNPDNPYIGRAPPSLPDAGRSPAGVRTVSGRHPAGAWPIYGCSKFIPPDVCDGLPDIGQASADVLAISLRCETPHQVLSPS